MRPIEHKDDNTHNDDRVLKFKYDDSFRIEAVTRCHSARCCVTYIDN